MDFKAVIPLLGFEKVLSYKLEQLDEIFFRLSNTEETYPTFTLIQPAALRKDYGFDLPKAAAEKLELAKEEDALVLNIMIIDTPLENSHVNFIAPIIFNKANGKMGQVVLDSNQYPEYGLADPIRLYLKPQPETAE